MDYLDKPKDILKSRVSIVDIPNTVKVEFRLILQNLKIPFDKLSKFFPKSKSITLSELIDHFKQLKRFESDQLIEQICRYLVENDTKGDIIKYDENADLDKIAIVSKFKNKIVEDDYKIFDETNELKKKEIENLQNEIKLILKPCVISFKEALDIEDFNSKGYISIDQFKNVIRQMELDFNKSHIEYLIYEMYKYSKNSNKLNYLKIFDVLSLKVDEDTPAKLESKEDTLDDYNEEFNIEDDEVKKKNINTKATTQREEAKETLNDVHQNDTELEFGGSNANKKLKEGGSN